MFTIYNFDPRTLSNDELFDKQLELIRRQLLAFRLGKVEMAEQIKIFIQAIEFERRERMFNDVFGVRMLNSASITIETDPDLKAADENLPEIVADKATTNDKPVSRPIRKPVRSDKPLPPKVNGKQ